MAGVWIRWVTFDTGRILCRVDRNVRHALFYALSVGWQLMQLALTTAIVGRRVIPRVVDDLII